MTSDYPHEPLPTPQFVDQPTRETLPTSAAMGRTNFRTSVLTLDRPGDPTVFGEQTRQEAAEIIARYPEGQARSALLPMLHLVQSVQGRVSVDGIAFCADTLDLTKAQVAAVATFYTMYKRVPTGEYLVSVCTNTLCGMLGGDDILAALGSELGVGPDETTADGRITLEHAECLAACDYAPVLTVNYEYFDNQTIDSASAIVEELRGGGRPMPTRGAPLCTFTQIERQIAGFFDDEAAFGADVNATGVPTERGVKLAIERGDTAPSYASSDSNSSSAGDSRPASAGEGPSASDAPLETAESDSANSTGPASERRAKNETNEEGTS